MKINNKIKEIEKELLTMRSSDLLEEKDFKGKIIDEFLEIIMKKLLSLGIKRGFEAGQKQSQKEIKELQEEIKNLIKNRFEETDKLFEEMLECPEYNHSHLRHEITIYNLTGKIK